MRNCVPLRATQQIDVLWCKKSQSRGSLWYSSVVQQHARNASYASSFYVSQRQNISAVARAGIIGISGSQNCRYSENDWNASITGWKGLLIPMTRLVGRWRLNAVRLDSVIHGESEELNITTPVTHCYFVYSLTLRSNYVNNQFRPWAPMALEILLLFFFCAQGISDTECNNYCYYYYY